MPQFFKNFTILSFTMALGAHMYPYSYIYYAPHRDRVLHNCIQLRREIEYLIHHRYLRRFIYPGNQAQSQTQNKNQAPTQQPPPRQTTTQHQQPLGEIHVISGGFAGGGESSSARKAHLCSIRSADMGEIQAVSKSAASRHYYHIL